MIIVLGLYNAFLFVCAVFGVHRLWLAFLALRHPAGDPQPRSLWDSLPVVTVQLPVFNEKYVVARLIDAACSLNYPRDRLEIQILDDSTDETTGIAEAEILRCRKRGLDVKLLRRNSREGYKAGALAEGLKEAKGEFIAVFDADFSPRPDFLLKCVHHFTDPAIGMVQCRWGHQNPDDSFLTYLQTVVIDGHFMVDQTARSSSGVFFNFNGSGGIWRKEAIISAGGWQSDTLAEDLDLSYRAQLAGWKFVLLTDYEVEQELPLGITAFKQQQFRWSKGSLEVAGKLCGRVWRSPIPLRAKLEAMLHLFGNVAYTFVALSAFIALPFAIAPQPSSVWHQYFVDLPLFIICLGSTFLYFAVSQLRLYRHAYQRLLLFPFVFAAIAGLALVHVQALIEVASGKKTPFNRTPKYGSQKAAGGYRLRAGRLLILESVMAVYLVLTAGYAVEKLVYGSLPFTLMLAGGYLYVSLKGFRELTPGKSRSVAGRVLHRVL